MRISGRLPLKAMGRRPTPTCRLMPRIRCDPVLVRGIACQPERPTNTADQQLPARPTWQTPVASMPAGAVVSSRRRGAGGRWCRRGAGGRCRRGAGGRCRRGAGGRCRRGAGGRCRRGAGGRCRRGHRGGRWRRTGWLRRGGAAGRQWSLRRGGAGRRRWSLYRGGRGPRERRGGGISVRGWARLRSRRRQARCRAGRGEYPLVPRLSTGGRVDSQGTVGRHGRQGCHCHRREWWDGIDRW
jgi:hypothetical protein